MLPPTHLVTDDDGGLTLPLYCVIEPHSEYLTSTSNQAWKARLLEQQLERERVVRLTQQQMAEQQAKKMLEAGVAAAAAVEVDGVDNQHDAAMQGEVCSCCSVCSGLPGCCSFALQHIFKHPW